MLRQSVAAYHACVFVCVSRWCAALSLGVLALQLRVVPDEAGDARMREMHAMVWVRDAGYC